MTTPDEIAKLLSELDDTSQELRPFVTPQPADDVKVWTEAELERWQALFRRMEAITARIRELEQALFAELRR